MVQADSETSLARMGDGLLDTGRPLALRYGAVSGGAKRYLMYNMQPYTTYKLGVLYMYTVVSSLRRQRYPPEMSDTAPSLM